jgi:hypothetical protein
VFSDTLTVVQLRKKLSESKFSFKTCKRSTSYFGVQKGEETDEVRFILDFQGSIWSWDERVAIFLWVMKVSMLHEQRSLHLICFAARQNGSPTPNSHHIFTHARQEYPSWIRVLINKIILSQVAINVLYTVQSFFSMFTGTDFWTLQQPHGSSPVPLTLDTTAATWIQSRDVNSVHYSSHMDPVPWRKLWTLQQPEGSSPVPLTLDTTAATCIQSRADNAGHYSSQMDPVPCR